MQSCCQHVSNVASRCQYNCSTVRWLDRVTLWREERGGVYRGLVGKPEGKRPFGRPRHRWEDNIKMDLQEVGCRGMQNGSRSLRIGTGGGHL